MFLRTAAGDWSLLEEEERLPRRFAPACCLIQISATLLSIFLKARSQRGGDSGEEDSVAVHPFFTTHRMEDYVGVLSEHWRAFQLPSNHTALQAMPLPPISDAADEIDVDAPAASGEAAVELVDVYLLPNEFAASGKKRKGLTDDLFGLRFTPRVRALYEDAMQPRRAPATGLQTHALLLDITVSRVADHVLNNVKDKALLVCRTFPTYAGLTVFGNGARLYLPEGAKAVGEVKIVRGRRSE